MTTSTLEPSFLQAVLFVAAFKPRCMVIAQAGLIALGLDKREFTAAELDPAITQGSKNLAGCASGSLVAMGILTVVRREKSPRPDAKGRKLDVFCIRPEKRGTAQAWMRANGFNAEGAQ